MKILSCAKWSFWAVTTTVLAALLLLAGCARPVVQAQAKLPALAPLITAGTEHYAVQSDKSNVRFLVYRAGPLAAFGHNHVIHAAKLEGDVYLNSQFALSGFRLTMPVKDFVVDEPGERALEGADFAEQPSAAAISGTIHNMLGPAVLDAAHYPDVQVRSVKITGAQSSPMLTCRITLHGVRRDVTVPVALKLSGEGLTVDGSFEIRQTDFGMAPFSILGGGLQVANQVTIHFHIVAKRV